MRTLKLPRRVVVTGMGAVSPLGRGVSTLFSRLKNGLSGITSVPEMQKITGLRPTVAGLVSGIDINEIPRKNRRSMSRMSIYALLAAQEALAQSGLEPENLQAASTGLVIGSTIGSTENLELFFEQYLDSHSVEQMKSMLFFRIMGHSVAANLAQSLGITGRVIAPSAACSTGCQAIGIGYENIAFGRQDCMLVGGADEFHPLTAATFDIMMAASTSYNEMPQNTPRPFDLKRDGIVCAEGAGILVLEAYESAVGRGADILGEIISFASTADPSSIANPSPYPLYACMKQALEQAELEPGAVDYINAHATGTQQGDQAECEAIAMLFGDKVPVSSLKGHLGHTMAASGALESIACLAMLQDETLIPTRNLEQLADECSGVKLLQKNEHVKISTVVKNNFALGGINCTLVMGK